MARKKSARQKAIIRRRIFITVCSAVLLLILGIIVFVVSSFMGDKGKENDNSNKGGNNLPSQSDETPEENKEPEIVINTTDPLIDGELNPDYEELLLVNGENPLPEDFDYESGLVKIPQKYLKGSLNQIDGNVWIFLQKMLDDARSEGIDIGVWSPYRSYATQKMLFNKQVQRQGGDEDKAATIVARPGTSEHHTGLALDINCANDSFENTKAFKWLCENAENYGFIMRYSADKQPITGVIHESWHWRFVGINHAKEINKQGLCLEEYVEYLENKKN